jgi:DNA-binding IscR family transcriptional regulator
MKLSHASGYALQALVSLAAQEGGGLLASRRAAQAHGMPKPFLIKVLRPLVAVGMLHPKKGPGGAEGAVVGEPGGHRWPPLRVC